MSQDTKLPEGIRDCWFLGTASGEVYESKIVHTSEVMNWLAEMLFGSVADADPVEMERHAASLADPDSWYVCDGKCVHWQHTMEDGSVEFQLIDDPHDVAVLKAFHK